MPSLLLSLGGPLQSWGSRSRFKERDTEREPTKSGVIGLLAGALGRKRGAPVADLAALRMAVRIDREGSLLRDYHTTLNVAKADGSGPAPNAVLSNRYYLCDALFLVGLEGPEEVIQAAHLALRQPRWFPALGRRSCPPSTPVLPPLPWDATSDLEQLLASYPWLPPLFGWPGDPPGFVRVVWECANGEEGSEARFDVPRDHRMREFSVRRVLQARLSTRELLSPEEGARVSHPD